MGQEARSLLGRPCKVSASPAQATAPRASQLCSWSATTSDPPAHQSHLLDTSRALGEAQGIWGAQMKALGLSSCSPSWKPGSPQ